MTVILVINMMLKNLLMTDRLSYLIHRSCHTPHIDKVAQRTNLFRIRCTVMGKVCDIIVDNGSTDNLNSAKAECHPKLYKVGWIKKGVSVSVNKSCIVVVPLSIGRRYKDEVLCDIVELAADHILLGRPWQYDVYVNHNGRTNRYTIKVDDMKISLTPLAPELHPNRKTQSNDTISE